MTRILWAMYLGGALSAFGNITYYDWQLYAIFVPTAILVAVFNR
jgi:hypothetical protein